MFNRNIISIGIAAIFLTSCAQEGANLTSTNNWTASKKLTNARAEISMSPAKVGKNTIQVKLMDDNGSPATGAAVTIATSMPSMNMKGPELTASESPPGVYRAESDLMQGPWRFDVSVKQPAGATDQIVIDTEIPNSVASQTETK